MERLQAYRYRLVPTAAQNTLFRRTAGSCRWVYNWGLAERHRVWDEERRSLGYTEQANRLPELKRAPETVWLAEVPSHCLQQALRDLDRAHRNFFEDLAKARRSELSWPEVRRPTFRRKGRHESFRFPDPTQVRLRGTKLFLPKAGWVRLRLSRPVIGTIRQATVSREDGHWYVSILTVREVPVPVRSTDRAVALDVGVAQSVTTDTGRVYQVPAPTAREMRHLRQLQRVVARRQKGSRRRDRARRRLARFQAKLARRRRDALHKITTELVQTHDVLYLEDLRVKAMTASARGTPEAPGRRVRQKAGLNRAILAQGWGTLRRLLEYKAAWAGARVVAVPAAYTSQRCSRCGHTEAGNRPTRDRFRCLACGHEACADTNAARNLLAAGQAATGRGALVRPALAAGRGDEAATPQAA